MTCGAEDLKICTAGASLGRRNSQPFFDNKSQTLLIFDWDDTLFPTTYASETAVECLEEFQPTGIQAYRLLSTLEVHLPVQVRDDLKLVWNKAFKDQELNAAQKRSIGEKLERCATHVVDLLRKADSYGHCLRHPL